MPRVLVVDDDQYLRESVRALLEEEGYEVCEARHGAEALDVLRLGSRPFVVLLDVVMPHVSGIDVLTLARGDAQLARHAFVIWTASRVPVPSELTEALAVPVLSKPFDLDALLAAVAAAAARLERVESA